MNSWLLGPIVLSEGPYPFLGPLLLSEGPYHSLGPLHLLGAPSAVREFLTSLHGSKELSDCTRVGPLVQSESS